MAPRNSKTGVKGLQYDSKGYLIYAHKQYVKEKGKPYRFPPGTPLSEAREMAMEANIKYDGYRKIITGETAYFKEVIRRYREEFIPTKNLKESTLKLDIGRVERIERDCGDWVTEQVTVKQVADYLDANHVNEAYKKHRRMLVEMFTFAVTKGLCEGNPAASTFATSTLKNEAKKRQRLTLDGFIATHECADFEVQNAMDIALITLQARLEVCNMKFDDVKDDSLYVIREKTKKHGDRAYIKIDIPSLGDYNPVDANLEQLIARCRDDIPSPYLIHRRPDRNVLGKKKHWTQLLPGYLSKQFAKARDKSGYFDDLSPEERPTFHEIRSLGGDLYLKAGYSKIFVNLLMGHTKMKMTDHYLEGHGVRWTEAKAELKL